MYHLSDHTQINSRNLSESQRFLSLCAGNLFIDWRNACITVLWLINADVVDPHF